jgi:hypothetical protein
MARQPIQPEGIPKSITPRPGRRRTLRHSEPGVTTGAGAVCTSRA